MHQQSPSLLVEKHWRAEARPCALPSSHEIRRAHDRGRLDWPGIALPIETFAAHVAARSVAGPDLAAHGSDLYLACACAGRHAGAAEAFERVYLRRVPHWVADLGLPGHVIDETAQRLGVDMLVGASPRVGGYRGKGPLVAWLRVCARRIASDIAGHSIWKTPVDEAALEGLVARHEGPEDVELALARAQIEPVFRASLQEALAALPEGQRALLRAYFLEGRNIDAIGLEHGVHRATAARWLEGIRAAVRRHVSESMQRDLRASPAEVEAMIRLIEPELRLGGLPIFAAPATRLC